MRKDGSRFWASVVIDPVRSPEGELIGFAKITRDLTERKKAQEELEETRERFLQSQKMEAIGKLTGGVAHDFNNLLSVILGSLHLAERRLDEGGDVRKLIANSLLAAQRGASLTQRMLAFARKQELQIERVDLSDLVRNMAEMLERTIGPGIQIETRFPLNLPAVQADARQLELALMNLFVNARDAMPNGGTITITAKVESLESSGPLNAGKYVRLSVADEGEGMDEATLARAIEPFFTTKGIGKGTGLGLPMVHGLAEQSNGKFSLTSEPGKGTQAELWLPVSVVVAADKRRGAKPARPAPTRALRILAVDDDTLVLANTATMLQELGHSVVEADSGHQALKILRSDNLDLVVTDYAMPGMTGEELAVAVKHEFPELPILMVSGYADLAPGIASNTLRLAKPFDEAALAAAIAKVVRADLSAGDNQVN
jgi:signal transduction histidine kinase/ActR/RegA family two-component response regulator